MGQQIHDTARGLLVESVSDALRSVRDELRLTAALRRAEHLRWVASHSGDTARDAAVLVHAVRTSDDLTAIAALHALSAVGDPTADELLLDTILAGSPLTAHAAWALGARRSSPAAIDALDALVLQGGFTAMLAERTLEQWGVARPLPPGPRTLEVTGEEASNGTHSNGTHSNGLVVVQPFLHAQLDREGTSLGAGDAGGIASLLRSLGAALGEHEDIARVVTITRRHAGEDRTEWIAPRHLVHRVEVGPPGPLPWREGWQYRRSIEDQLVAFGASLDASRVVWHLRMADVGTLAASAAARRLGHGVVFTAAPDPHIVIDALQDGGRLDRSNFGVEDASAQIWFRARMVERLSAQADHLALLPRPTIERELVELVGLEPVDLSTRSTVVPEGVDIVAIERARTAVDGAVPAVVRRVLDGLQPERQDLPWLLTVGRLHPSKGPQRIVQAVCAEPTLAGRVNIVVVGGDLVQPTPDEQSTIERIRLAARDADPELVTLTGHLPPSQVAELMAYVASTDGVYVCASDKEEFGLAIVEALGTGATVVAPERGGPRTYVAQGRTGVLCDTQSIDALRAAIMSALALTRMPGRSAAARHMVRQDLSVQRMAAGLAGIYSRLAPPLHADTSVATR